MAWPYLKMIPKQHFLCFLRYFLKLCTKKNVFLQETPQCHETRFSRIQPSIDVTGIQYERWQWRKNDAVILVALVGESILKLLSVNWISIFSNSDLDLDHIHLGSNPSKIDQSKKKMNRHDPSIVVHIYFKFHEILPASEWEMAVNVHFSKKGNNSKDNWPIKFFFWRASFQYSGSYLF